MTYIAELGGNVVLRDENMETSISGLYVAGDVAGIEEASSAMLEGRMAGISAVEAFKGSTEGMIKMKEEVKKGLASLRTGPFGRQARIGEEKMKEAAKK